MKSYDELKAEMESIQQQMVEAKKNERANALKEVKRLCKEFGFTADMLKGALAEGAEEEMKRIQATGLFSKIELEEFLKQFRAHYISCDLLRIGGDGDGGYLLPDIFDNTSYCFSPGVSYIANFEKELSDRFNIKSFMADASVEKAPLSDNNFDFMPKFLGAHSSEKFITLSDWLMQKNLQDESNLLLQMDIEGGEYDVLIYEDSTTLASFSAMVIEFHSLQKLFERDFLRMVSAIFEKIYKKFSICHVHPNNCCGIQSVDGINIPRVIEVTFIRNDLIAEFANDKPLTLPHPLDSKNVEKNDDITMPFEWWKQE